MTGSKIFAVLAWAALSVGLCSTAAAQAVVIGAKEFTEQLLVAEMTAQLLRASGLSPHKGTGFATTGVRTLQERGIVDVYWEYTETSLITFNHVTEKLSADEAYERVRTLDAERGLFGSRPPKSITPMRWPCVELMRQEGASVPSPILQRGAGRRCPHPGIHS